MDKEQFTRYILEAETTMYRISKTILMNDSDCEDAVQDAVLKAYSKLYSLRDERYFKTWLIRILMNECYRKKREQTRLVPIDDSMEIPSSEENYSELYSAVMKLKQEIRIVIVLYYIEGYSVGEIGKILKIPQGTVKSRLYIGRRILKEELEDEEI